MPPTRRKAPRQQAPQTIEEATALLGRYAGFLTEAERLRAEADQAKAAIDAARDMALAPIEQEAKGIFLQLRAWWGVAGTELTEGKRKSYEIAGCILGERTTPPSLAMPAKDEEAATILINAELSDLCRFKITVDKPAVLKVLADKPRLLDELEQLIDATDEGAFERAMELTIGIERATKVAELGFAPRQKEEFFIDRAAEKAAAVEEVPLQEAAE